MLNEENQVHNFISSSGSGTVINYGSGSGSDFLTSYGSGSTSQKVTVLQIRFRFHNTAKKSPPPHLHAFGPRGLHPSILSTIPQPVTSVADPWHFGVDPDPDPRIHASD